MRVHRGTFAVLSTGIVLANAPLARAQDATSANLPEHVDTGEAMLTPKPKKKKAESSLKIAARSSSQKRAYVTEHTPPPEEPVTPAAPLEKKARGKKPPTSAARADAPSSPVVHFIVVTGCPSHGSERSVAGVPIPGEARQYHWKRCLRHDYRCWERQRH